MTRQIYAPRLVATSCAILVSVVSGCGDSGDPVPLESRERQSTGQMGSANPPGKGDTGSSDTKQGGKVGAPSGGGTGVSRALPPQGKREVALVQNLVKALVRGLNEGDPSICTRLYDQRLVERGKRDAVVAGCRRQTAAAQRPIRLFSIESVRIVDKRTETVALVQFLLETRGRRYRYRFRLRRSGDAAFRIDAALPVKQP